MNILKRLFRVFSYPFFYTYYLLKKNKVNISSLGEPLKMGITAVVAMKNEEYTIPFCLESLVGFADQIVVVDNGSEDESVKKAQEFKNRFGHLVEVSIIEMPGALLGDCREAGLKATKYQWHLRWDADMIAYTSGKNDIKRLREKALSSNTPRTIQFCRINNYGDFKHSYLIPVDGGEPFLMWFTKDIHYVEYGKFDAVKVPYYYKQVVDSINYYCLHCGGLKSDENLMHRFHYFTWREWTNKSKPESLPAFMKDYNKFKEKRNLYLFGTNESNALKYRFSKQFVHVLKKFDSNKYGGYPDVILDELKNPRFEVVYENNKPLKRIDKNDISMLQYKPTTEDLNWSVDEFNKKINNEFYTNYN